MHWSTVAEAWRAERAKQDIAALLDEGAEMLDDSLEGVERAEAIVLAGRGIAKSADEVLVTSGAQQGIDLWSTSQGCRAYGQLGGDCADQLDAVARDLFKSGGGEAAGGGRRCNARP